MILAQTTWLRKILTQLLVQLPEGVLTSPLPTPLPEELALFAGSSLLNALLIPAQHKGCLPGEKLL